MVDGIEEVIRHDKHFYQNVCHYCKRFGKDNVKLIRCHKCEITAFCSPEHRIQDATHDRICQSIYLVRTIFNDIQGTSQSVRTRVEQRGSTEEERIRKKLVFIQELKKIKSRPLFPHEEEMILFSRSCVECYREDNLQDCPNCGSTSFCMDHLHNNRHSAQNCASLVLCLNLDTREYQFLIDTDYIRHIPPHENLFVSSTNEFFNIYVKPYLQVEIKTPQLFDKVRAIHSEYCTRPLTLLYAMKRINYSFNEKIIIHVIGSNRVEVSSNAYWEILFHLISKIKHLKIIFVGPQLTSCCVKLKLCQQCLGKNLHIEQHDTLYGNYLHYDCYETPDIVVGYNIMIHCDYNRLSVYLDTWRDSISELIKLIPDGCPFILTSYKKDNMEREIAEISVVAERRVNYAIKEPNPFVSLRPQRDRYSEQVVYSNCYVTVYTALRE